MKSKRILALTLSLLVLAAHSYAIENFTTVKLNYIDATDAITTIKSITKYPVAISEHNNLIIIKDTSKKSKNLIKLIKEIDQPADALKLDFIASKRRISFNNPNTHLESSRDINRTSQTLMITERQWVSLNTGISIPITERQKTMMALKA